MPCGRLVHAAGAVAPCAAHALCQPVYVEVRPPLGVLCQLKLIQTQRQVVQERGGFLHAHHRPVKGLDVAAHGRVAPHAGDHHQGHRLAGAGIHAPQVYEEGQAPQRLQQRCGKGRRQHDLGRYRHAPDLRRHLLPLGKAAPLMHRLEHGGKVGVAVKDQALHIGGKALARDIAEPPDAFPFRYQLIVQVFQVADVLHKGFGRFAVHRDTDPRQLRHLVGAGQRPLLHNAPAPHSALPEGQPQLFLAGVDVHQPLHRHHRMGTRHALHAAVGAPYSAVIGFPVSGVQLQRLPVKPRGIVAHIDSPSGAAGLYRLAVFPVHQLQLPETQ